MLLSLINMHAITYPREFREEMRVFIPAQNVAFPTSNFNWETRVSRVGDS